MALSNDTISRYADLCTPNTETGSLNYRAFARAIEAEARRDALEEAARVCDQMHEEDRPGDYAYAIRKLKEDIQ